MSSATATTRPFVDSHGLSDAMKVDLIGTRQQMNAERRNDTALRVGQPVLRASRDLEKERPLFLALDHEEDGLAHRRHFSRIPPSFPDLASPQDPIGSHGHDRYPAPE